MYRKYTLKKVLLSYPNQNSISTNGKTIDIEHFVNHLLCCTHYRRVERVCNGISLITPLYQWMQLSVACSLPYSSVLFHSYSLLNIAVAHQTLTELHQPCSSNSIAVVHWTLTELYAAYCGSALLINLNTNARWNLWAWNCTSCFNAGRMS